MAGHTKRVPEPTATLEVAFACLVLFVAVQMLRRSFSEPHPAP